MLEECAEELSKELWPCASGAGVLRNLDRGWPFESAKMYGAPAGHVLAAGNHVCGAPGQLPDFEMRLSRGSLQGSFRSRHLRPF